MTLKMNALVVLATMLFTGSVFARENHFEKFWNSTEVRDLVRTGEDFTVIYKGSDSLLHKGSEVTLEVRPTNNDSDKNCNRVYMKGSGHSFKELRENLEDLMEDKDGFVSSIYHRKGHPNSLETVICEDKDLNQKAAPVKKDED